MLRRKFELRIFSIVSKHCKHFAYQNFSVILFHCVQEKYQNVGNKVGMKIHCRFWKCQAKKVYKL